MRLHCVNIAASCLIVLALAGCSDSSMDADMNHNDNLVVTVLPPDGAVNVALDAVITVAFSLAMDTASVGPQFMMHRGWSVGGRRLDGHRVWSNGARTLTFHPDQPLEPQSTYTIHLQGEMRGMDGMMHRGMPDSMMNGGMHSGMMMGGYMETEMRFACSTGPEIRHQIDLDLTGDVVLVADGGSGDLAAIDPTTNALIGVQPLNMVMYLHHLYLSTARDRVIVSDVPEDLSGGHGGHGGQGEIMSHVILLDSRTLLETARLMINGVAHNGVVTPSGHSLLAANATTSRVLEYSYPGLVFQREFAVGGGPLEVSVTPDGLHALSANGSGGSVTRITLASGETSTLAVGQSPVGAWLSPDGQRAWVTNEESQTISVLTIDPFDVVRTINLGFKPGQAFEHPTRNEAYVADETNGSVHVYDLIQNQFVAEISTGSGAHGIAFSPDGSKAYSSNEHAESVSVIDCQTRAVIATIAVGLKPNGITFRSAP